MSSCKQFIWRKKVNFIYWHSSDKLITQMHLFTLHSTRSNDVANQVFLYSLLISYIIYTTRHLKIIATLTDMKPYIWHLLLVIVYVKCQSTCNVNLWKGPKINVESIIASAIEGFRWWITARVTHSIFKYWRINHFKEALLRGFNEMYQKQRKRPESIKREELSLFKLLRHFLK